MSQAAVTNHIRIAEVKLGQKDEVLETFVGSCVAIAFIFNDKKQQIFKCAMAHCLLPSAPEEFLHQPGAKYVDQAIHSLISLMGLQANDFKNVQAVVAGGANMTNSKQSEDKLIGSANSKLALEILGKNKIPIIFQDIGGNSGRKIFLDCRSGDYKVESIKKVIAA